MIVLLLLCCLDVITFSDEDDHDDHDDHDDDDDDDDDDNDEKSFDTIAGHTTL
jgi:hypothetical protein